MNKDIKKLYIDIETAPNIVYSWGLFNQNISIEQIVKSGHTLSFAAKWEGEKEVAFYSTYHDGEDKMIKKAWEYLDKADIIVHYNGRSFDIPILNKEFIKHKLTPPSPYQQVDLLIDGARKRFKFVSNKLDYVSKFLGLESKVQHKGMRLWVECLEGDNDAWEKMREYNIQDVNLLPKLYKVLLPWIQNHPNMALYTDTEEIICTNCGSTHLKKNGVENLATQRYQRYKCKECGTNLKGRRTILPLSKRQTVLTQSKL